MDGTKLLQRAKEFSDKLVSYRQHIHKNPEIGFELKETADFVKKELEDMGYIPKACGKSGIVAVAGGKKAGKVFLIRADMDALPIKEETELEFASKNGNMHACGHDMHTAMLLGAAKLLKENEAEIKGTVKLMFQPAEEILEGSKDMIEAGILENPKVDAAFMIHVMANMPFEAGTVIVSSPGISAPAASYFDINIKGKGCHGSSPNMGVDPISAAAHTLIALQEINARELSISEPAAITIGAIHAGQAGNVIADAAVMKGSLRCYNQETMDYIKSRLIEISQGIAVTFRAKAEVTFNNGCPVLDNDKDLSEFTLKNLKGLLGEQKVFSSLQISGGKAAKTSGSEDFAYISQKVPSLMMALSAGQTEKGYIYPQHHPKVKFDEQVLSVGSAIYAFIAMKWLEEH